MGAENIDRVLESAACVEAAKEQFGLLKRKQLVGFGLTAVDIARAVILGKLKRRLPRVYELSSHEDAFLQSLRAATLWIPQAAVSHRAAAKLHQLDGVRAPPVELTTRKGTKRRRNGIIVHRLASVCPTTDLTRVHGMRVTTVERTLFDLAGVVDELALAMAVEHALRSKRVTLERLQRRFEKFRRSGVDGVASMENVLEDHEARGVTLQSALEVRMWREFKAAGMTPQLQVPFEVGARFGAMDFLFAESKVVVETLGKAAHDGETLDKDSWRSLLLSSVGYTVVPVTWNMLEADTKAVLQLIRDAIAVNAPRAKRIVVSSDFMVLST